jgi:hypothetical protein
MTAELSTDLLAEALFASDLQPSDHSPDDLIRAAVDDFARRLGETGCAAAVAQEFGEHPDCACRRMAWARAAVAEAFAA